jgi:hypothetical protein
MKAEEEQGHSLLQLQNRPRRVKREHKIKIDVGKTEYPLLRTVATGDLGWRVWTREGKPTST